MMMIRTKQARPKQKVLSGNSRIKWTWYIFSDTITSMGMKMIRENSSLWFCPCPCPVICPLFLPCNFCPVNFALCFALLVFVLLFLPLPLGWYFHFHCGCCVRGHFLITMIFLFQMLDLLLKTDGGWGGMVIDIVVGMEVVKVAKEVAEMVDSVFALILCPLYYALSV